MTSAKVLEALKDLSTIATIDELAALLGMSVSDLMLELEDFLSDSSVMQIETVAGEARFFLWTAPYGRPIEHCEIELGRSLWESLRIGNNPEEASTHLSTIRNLERQGWKCWTRADILEMFGDVHTVYRPEIFVQHNNQVAPVVNGVSAREASAGAGVLSDIQRGGFTEAFLLCESGEEELYVAGVRTWHRRGGGIPVVVCSIDGERSDMIEVVNHGVQRKNT